MRRLLIFTTLIGLFAALGLAETYSGKLIDAACLNQARPTLATCQPSSSTTTFALVDDARKIYKLDDQGNTKAANALKNRADRSADPNAAPKEGDVVVVKITGALTDSTVHVETIEVH